jgi:hypothetical protein
MARVCAKPAPRLTALADGDAGADALALVGQVPLLEASLLMEGTLVVK